MEIDHLDGNESVLSALQEYVKIVINDTAGGAEFSLSYLPNSSIGKIKHMAALHFIAQYQNTARKNCVASHQSVPAAGPKRIPRFAGASKAMPHQGFIPVVLKEFVLFNVDPLIRLRDELTLSHYDLKGVVYLLLAPARNSFNPYTSMEVHVTHPLPAQIRGDEYAAVVRMAEKAGVLPNLFEKGPPPASCSKPAGHSSNDHPYQFLLSRNNNDHLNQVIMKRVYLTLAYCSIRMLGNSEETIRIFKLIIARLNRRQVMASKPVNVQKIRDLGFSTECAIIVAKNIGCGDEAVNWLLENDPHKYLPPSDLPPMNYGPTDDPAETLIPYFWEYARKYFFIDEDSYVTLLNKHYEPTKIFDALLIADNDLEVAEILLNEEKLRAKNVITGPLSLDNPIIETLLSTHVIQNSLHKSKLLFAFLALCEMPKSSHLWLTDSDSNCVITLIIKVFHEECYNQLNYDLNLSSNFTVPD